MTDLDRIVLQWRQVDALIRHFSEQAEAKIVEANRAIRSLAETGMLAETVVLGAIIHQRNYSPVPGGNDSGEVVQAVLHVPRGIGVVRWDSEVYFGLQNVPDGLASQACQDAIPFDRCEPLFKALLWSQIEPLIQQLQERLL